MSRMKKGIGLLAGAALASLSFGMIIQAEQLEGDIVLATMNTGEVGEATEEIIDAFMEENPEVNVEIQVNTTDYENLMKAKMAANDLPDVFMTHGWSLLRYSEYLYPLTDETWAENMSDTLKESMCDKEGNFMPYQ